MPAGLQDNNARDYSPATGRFISADPTGTAGSGDNLYAYAGNDTVDNSDPSGLQWQLLAGCAVGGLVNDIGGALDGRKHSFGDFFGGALLGCVGGALMTIGGAGDALEALEGGDLGAAGTDGGADLGSLGDDLSGDGAGEDGLGADSCDTAPNSFAGSTPVTLASGKTEPIRKIKPGDKVLATDPATGKTSPEPVTAVIRGHKHERLVRLTVAAGRGHRRHSGGITATAGHLFWNLTRRGWTRAGRLHRGDRLRALSGIRIVVTAIRRFSRRDATVYNLSIGTDHTYYVTAARTAVLVHNCDPAPRSIGHSPDYIDLAGNIGGKHFSVPDDVWNSMNPAEQWAANQRFLDRGIAEGAVFRLATPIEDMRDPSIYAKEINYMLNHGLHV
jgi:hypothetical protein